MFGNFFIKGRKKQVQHYLVKRFRTFFFLLLLFFSTLYLWAALTTKNTTPELHPEKWLNTSDQISRAKLQGKIVVYHFWNSSTQRGLWELKLLDQIAYEYPPKKFQVIGIYTPEFDFDRNEALVAQLIKDEKVMHPVALDFTRNLWNLYHQPPRPGFLLADQDGNLRQSFGPETDYNKLRASVEELLADINVDFSDVQAPLPTFRTLFNFKLGFKDVTSYGNLVPLKAYETHVFDYPAELLPDRYYLKGAWKINEESAENSQNPVSLKITTNAELVGIVAGSLSNQISPVEIRMDGIPLTKKNKGKKAVIQDHKSYVFIKDYRYYEIIKLPEFSGNHTVELLFEEGRIEIFKLSGATISKKTISKRSAA